jgi:hypothetical protein
VIFLGAKRGENIKCDGKRGDEPVFVLPELLLARIAPLPELSFSWYNIYNDAIEAMSAGHAGGGMRECIVNGFESTSSFCVLPLQPVPHGGCDPSGLMERGGFFFSGPMERGALSGPLDIGAVDPGGGPVLYTKDPDHAWKLPAQNPRK